MAGRPGSGPPEHERTVARQLHPRAQLPALAIQGGPHPRQVSPLQPLEAEAPGAEGCHLQAQQPPGSRVEREVVRKDEIAFKREVEGMGRTSEFTAKRAT